MKIVTVCAMFFAWSFFAQKQDFVIPDSLKNASYNDLYERAAKTYATDTLTTIIYFKTHLQKAKNENNSKFMAQGYGFLSHFADEESHKLALLDSAIHVSENLDHTYYPMLPYSLKGAYFRRKNRFGLALDNYLKVLELAKKHEEDEYLYTTMYNIAVIKHDLGKDKEALPIFKESLNYELNKTNRDTLTYLQMLKGVSESFTRNNILDSAAIYNAEGLKITKTLYKDLHSTFLINKGTNLFQNQKYKLAQDNLKEGIKLINKKGIEYKKYLVRAYFYLGETELIFNNPDKAEQYFRSVDSLIQKDVVVLPELRKGYEFLMNYYKNNNDNKNYLEYINRLLKFDSILYNDRGLISDRLIREYDTPMILLEKENAIEVLENDKKNLGWIIGFSFLLTFIAIAMFYYQFIKRRLYKKRFEALMASKDVIRNAVKLTPSITQDLDISEKIVNPILEALELFENKKAFLNKNITKTSLSKEIGTNSKYLSKIVNHYKKKTFTMYINDLRVNHAVESLKTDRKLRRYTIQGIAEEMGFNNAESFSSAFKRSTGIKPSYFIKKISQAA